LVNRSEKRLEPLGITSYASNARISSAGSDYNPGLSMSTRWSFYLTSIPVKSTYNRSTRPASTKVSSGNPTRLVQVDGCLAASWQQQSRHVTVIGAKDMDEMTRLVAHFNQPAPALKE
jgi:hypothetical protein